MGSARPILHLCVIIALCVTGGRPALSASTQQITNPVNDFRVVLLGTGTPNPRPDRFGPSILVEAGSERLVFDCGRAKSRRHLFGTGRGGA